MKVLWLCNIMLPRIAEALGYEASNKEGWLSGLADAILEQEQSKIELFVCFPVDKDKLKGKNLLTGKTAGMTYFGFYENTARAEVYESHLEKSMAKILKQVKPDIVHIFGTEYPHALAMARVCPDKNRVLVGLQGICSEIAKAYTAHLPKHVVNRFLFRDLVKWDNIRIQQKKFRKRGEHELEVLRLAGHIAGRTKWDQKMAQKAHPEASYHVLNETLRTPFYEGEWLLSGCEPHSIFLSQGDYPIKGLHYLLRALPELLEEYPDLKIYIAGNNVCAYGTLMQKIKLSSYGKYCLDLIRAASAEDKVLFLGRLNAEEMKAQYLKSHVFLSPSAKENSPNSVGEAMLFGMPVISSRVGGVPSMLTDQKEGLLYPVGDKEALIECIRAVFSDDTLAVSLGRTAGERARKTHDGKENLRQLLAIYDGMKNTGESV